MRLAEFRPVVRGNGCSGYTVPAMPGQDRRVTRRAKLPEWGRDVAVQTVGSALGTLVAALTLFLGGVVFGLINDVGLASILGAVATLAGALAGLAAGARASQVAASARERIDRRKLDTEIEEARRLHERSKAWARDAERRAADAKAAVGRLSRQALAAERRGDTPAAEAMLEEAYALAADAAYRTEIATQQVDRVEDFLQYVEDRARSYGFEPEEPDEAQ